MSPMNELLQSIKDMLMIFLSFGDFCLIKLGTSITKVTKVVCIEWPNKQMAFNKKFLSLKSQQTSAHYTTTFYTCANSLSSPRHHFFLIFSISSELSRCLYISVRSIFVAGAQEQPRSAIGWYTKWIIQIISPLWLFLLVLCNESPCC